jgi:hypothetical protein
MIIEARIDDGFDSSEATRLAECERLDGDLKQLGITWLKAEVWYTRRSVHWCAHGFVLLFRPP